MNKTTILNTPADDNSAYEAEVDYYLAEMKRLQHIMKNDRHEIETLQAETNAILADIMQTLRAA
jgi:hypothetical protein